MEDESCFLPNPCDCSLCQYWAENNCDLSSTPDWQMPKYDDGDA